MKRFTRDEESEIARRVYRQWAESAEIIRKSGRHPSDLSSIGRREIDHAANFTDPEEEKTLTKAAVARIKHEALAWERWGK